FVASAGGGSTESRSSAQRNADRVLPEPVGATTRACSPACAARQAPSCAAVGAAKAPANQSRVAGEKRSSTSAATSSMMRGTTDSFRLAGQDHALGELRVHDVDPGFVGDRPVVAA